MTILFIVCIDAILNDVLVFEVIKSKAPEFAVIQKVSGNASKNSCHVIMLHFIIAPCELF